MSLDRFLLHCPKVELHVHLEGAMRPAVLLELARRNGIELPARDEAGLKRWFRFTDFNHFVQIYLACSRALRKPEDFQFLVLDFLAEQATQNVLHTEAHFTIATHLANGANGGEILAALAEAIAEGERRYDVTLRLIPDIVRNVGVGPADQTLEWALAGQAEGTVVALGLSGSEAQFPNEPFREHFVAAERGGLHRVAHAGEHAGPESIRSVLEVCGAERIGHGVRAVDDPSLMAELQASQIPLEVNPTSNVCLGVVPDLPSHPFNRLYRAGLALSVNSDDPAFFNTNLTREYLKLHQTFGYSPAELAGLSLAALRQSFLPDEEKAALDERFRQQFDALGRELFGSPVEAPVS
ncbi:MAG TPA: adenosine deaminase [Thermoanaerobaculia bacterium]|jgi:adenosine deaminase|nr:adenosine deaminase [Thermoanaerobaculia bacterium]